MISRETLALCVCPLGRVVCHFNDEIINKNIVNIHLDMAPSIHPSFKPSIHQSLKLFINHEIIPQSAFEAVVIKSLAVPLSLSVYILR